MRYYIYQLLDDFRSFNLMYPESCLNFFLFFFLIFSSFFQSSRYKNHLPKSEGCSKPENKMILEKYNRVCFPHPKERKKKLIYTLTEWCNLCLTKYKWEEVWKMPCKMLKSSASEKEEKLQDVIHCRVHCVFKITCFSICSSFDRWAVSYCS